MRILYALIFTLIFFACTDPEKIPGDVLEKDKMERVLWDMMIADRYSAQFLLKDSSTRDVKKETFQIYDQVFQVHKISRDEFLKSLKYYLDRPDLGKQMFDSISVRATRNRDTVYKNMRKKIE